MLLELKRFDYGPKSTVGRLFVDGEYQCYTLEDAVRGPGVKIPGETAIPEGTYEVVIDYSNRFQRPMPRILNVPMFEGIRIHAGNTDADTEGCILLGKTYDKSNEDFIGESRLAFAEFFPKLEEALKTTKVLIRIGEA